MARRKHHKRRHRRYGSYVSIPAFGKLNLKAMNPLGKHVNSTDLFLGAAVALVGGSAVKMGISKLDTASGGKVPQFVKDYLGPIASLLAGVGGYFFFKKKPAKAQGVLVGSVLTAITPIVWATLKSAAPTFFNDYVQVPALGMLTRDGRMNGFGRFGVLTRDGRMSGFGESDSIENIMEPA